MNVILEIFANLFVLFWEVGVICVMSLLSSKYWVSVKFFLILVLFISSLIAYEHLYAIDPEIWVQNWTVMRKRKQSFRDNESKKNEKEEQV